jgi:hypothetical protein
MIPEPTTAASSNAVPSASATRRRVSEVELAGGDAAARGERRRDADSGRSDVVVAVGRGMNVTFV